MHRFGLLAVLAIAACFRSAPSKGGGQVSREAVAQAEQVAPSPYDIELPPGYAIELVADGLTFPTGIAISPRNELYVVEAGYSYGEVFTTPKLLQLLPDRQVRELATGGGGEPWNGIAYHDGAVVVAQGGELDGGRIVRFDLREGRAEPHVLVDHLPSMGDHHTNGPVVSRDGWVYFGQGTATNSGVVGKNDAEFGWLARHPEVHDIPCQDVTLAGHAWRIDDPRDGHTGQATTGAYQAFGSAGEPGQVIQGQVPCSGAVMRVPVGGGPLELVAWGLRNPYGLALDGNERLYVTENGYDTRGSRPVFGAADVVWRIEPGRWYGWPDYAEGRPLTSAEWNESGGNTGGFVLARHFGQPPRPTAYLPVHSSADGFDISRNPAFGQLGYAFVALFGDMAPRVGKVLGPVGFKVVRVNLTTGTVEDFARNRGDANGPASRLQLSGLERPIAARFSPDGSALYIVDFGIMRMTGKGPESQPHTGRVWRIVRGGPHATR
jgi:glucose/arabinose dehydrogenase